MRQVNEAELIWAIRYSLGRLSLTQRAGLAARDTESRHRAERAVAHDIARTALKNYEVLSSAPLPPGADLFTAAAFGTGSGRAPTTDE